MVSKSSRPAFLCDHHIIVIAIVVVIVVIVVVAVITFVLLFFSTHPINSIHLLAIADIQSRQPR